MSIRNPVEWGVDQVKHTIHGVESANRGLFPTEDDTLLPFPTVRKITVADLKDVLARGFSDFGAERTDVIFLCGLYPIIGLIMASLAAGQQMLPLLFPLASGFALIGPFAGIGLNEMSRRREQGSNQGWGSLLNRLLTILRFFAFSAFQIHQRRGRRDAQRKRRLPMDGDRYEAKTFSGNISLEASLACNCSGLHHLSFPLSSSGTSSISAS